jgi:type II secretory pathway pseudopilin PulG
MIRPVNVVRGRRGISLMELMVMIACLEIMLGASAAVVQRQSVQAVELEAYTQAVLAAQQALETRRVKGRFPVGAEVERLRASIGLLNDPAVQTREERFRGTPLSQVTVTVTWRSAGPSVHARREVRLSSLARPR